MRRLNYAVCAGALAISTMSSARADDFTATKYPIFLAEGFGGGDYFMVEEALEASGAIVCDQPDDQVPHFAGSEARAAVLIAQIHDCAVQNGVGMVNLIAYSQGGEDARVVLKKRPDLVASVTTVGTGHRGSSNIADLFLACAARQQLGLPCTAYEQGAFNGFIALGSVGGDPDAPNPPDIEGVLEAQCQFSSGTNLLALAACATRGFIIGPVFDLKYPQGLPVTPCGAGPSFVFGPGFKKIYLFSWGGAQVLTDPADPSDAILQVTSAYQGTDNDGVIERCTNHFGKVIRDDYPWNHLDLVNLRDGLTGPNDPTVAFREHAHRLKGLGL
jgi:triacylglycerol lipase